VSAVAVLAAQYAGTLDFLDTTRVDVVATQPYPIAPSPPPRYIVVAANVTTAPTARLLLRDRRWDYGLNYVPSIALTDVELGTEARPLLLNAGTLTVGWHDRFVRVTVSESAAYGFESLAYVYSTPVQATTPASSQSPTTGQTTTMAPATGTASMPMTTPVTGPTQSGQATSTNPLKLFPYALSTTAASLAVQASRRMSVSMSGGYSVAGNLTSDPQAAIGLPEQFGPFGAASVGYSLSPRDSVATTARGQETTTPMGLCPGAVLTFCRQVEPVLGVQETVRHEISTASAVSVGLGVAASIQQLPTERAWTILPTGSMSFTERLDVQDTNPSFLRFSASLGPVVDINSGQLSNQFAANLSLVNQVASNVVLTILVSGLRSVPPDPTPVTGFSGGGSARFRINRQVDLTFGVQAFWQDQSAYAGAGQSTIPTTATSEVAYTALTARLPTIHF
jgi:hypothetical protein